MSECNKINQRIEAYGQGKHINTEGICRDIFHFFGEDLPEKIVIGTGTKGQQWWAYQGRRMHIIYKNKRFVAHDLLNHTTIHNLWSAWEYASEMSEVQAAKTTPT
jgi:hypothetical protein